ncbi:MAG: peptide synthetase, partial [Oscillospiraceae bacterium]|nr:peptide synthetase [Oscillospiraceae bacterium]
MKVRLKSGKSVEAYPLIPAQFLMLYASRYHSKDAPVLNIVTGYYWQGDFDTESMKEALYEAMERCDTMRLRFTK